MRGGSRFPASCYAAAANCELKRILDVSRRCTQNPLKTRNRLIASVEITRPIIQRMHRYVIRAAFSQSTVRVYQAYRAEIATPALAAGRFVPPFKMERMTWIKPSFNWMMYRCGYATKAGQEVVLGIDITRRGFEWALEHAVLSSFNPSIHSSHDEWRSSLSEAPGMGSRSSLSRERTHRATRNRPVPDSRFSIRGKK